MQPFTVMAAAFNPAGDTTAVFGPDVDGQADEDDQDTFKGSWIEVHKLKR